VLEPDLSGSLTLDLSVDSDLWTAGEWASTGATWALLPSGGFLVGRWGEARLTDSGGPGPLAPANLHLGADLFVPVGIPVRSPLMARVRSTSGEDITLDLRPAGVALDLRLTGIRVDRSVVAGDVVSPGAGLGTVAAAAGDLGAHLHVQLLADPALPPLGRPTERDAWLALCPDPSALIGHSVAAPQVVPAERIRDERAAHVADPQHLYYEDALEVVRGWRHVMYDSDGRAYLDMINNIATVGHSHPRVTEAATRQFRRLNTNSRFLYTSMTRYADRVAELLPPELDSIFLVNSGSEAADLALQLARQRTGRRDVLALEAAYHGWTGAVIDLSTSPNDRPNWRTELQPHIHIVDQPNPYRGKHGALPDGYVASVAAACERAAGAGGPAAFVSEPLLGNQGAVEPPVSFLARAYETVRAAGGLCIADEVQVGMARAGTFWAFEHEGVVPDIVYTAKATGNGHPLGVVACRREIADAFNARTAYFSSTGGGPVSCEVGIAVLDVIRDEDLVHHARVVGGRLKAELSALAGRHPLVGAVHGRGLFLGVDLVADPVTKAPATLDADRVSELLRDRGIIMQSTGDALNVLKVKPQLCIDDEAAAYFLTHLDAVLGEIERWPGR